MELRSLGYLSQTIFTDFDGQIDDRGAYLVMRSLTNPNFFWGNLLIFPRPPAGEDFETWSALFKKEFTDPRIYHMTFAWDAEGVGDVSRFEENGFGLETHWVLACSEKELRPPRRPCPGLEVRPLESELEWNRMVEVQVDAAHGDLPRHEWESFHQAQKLRYQAMVRADRGAWFGGFLEGRLVAGLGLFHNGKLARYQTVCTHPQFTRRGICANLVHQSALHAFREWGVERLVMCADPDYHAVRIYQSVGFRQTGAEHGVSWWDRRHG